jgi:8-amino-7-oxononanoate synthase
MGQLQERYKNYREPQKYMAAGVYPYFREITSKQMTEVTDIDGHKILMFGSNAYQGLTNDQRVIDAAKAALDKYGSGCAGSRFLNGTLDLHVQLEKELAEFMGKDETLCFSTGFSVNQGVLACVVGRNDYVICDDRDHASIVDGRRLSFATQLHYKHNDMEDLAALRGNFSGPGSTPSCSRPLSIASFIVFQMLAKKSQISGPSHFSTYSQYERPFS